MDTANARAYGDACANRAIIDDFAEDNSTMGGLDGLGGKLER
jgi:hypothetical protein